MKKNTIKYILPPLVATIIVIIISMLKGIYPFGDMTIDYHDNMQQVAPLYNHLWDFLHGRANLFFDWYTGLGTNLSMAVSAFSMLSPFNLILYLVPRSAVHQSFYFLFLIKIAFMSETMYIYLNSKFNTSYIFKFSFSLMFALSGYQMLYGTTFMPWMDVITFFPLIMLGLDNIYKGKSSVLYIVTLTLAFIINYYVAALILFFILVASGIYLTIFVDKKERKKYIYKLGIGTILSIGIAAFILVPTFMQLINSERSSSNGLTPIEQILCILNTTPTKGNWRLEQYFLYALSSLPAVLIFWGMRKYKKEKKVVKAVRILLVLMIIPLLVEGTNLLLHFGSYAAYCMRHSFIIKFVFLTIGCYYSSKIKLDEAKLKPRDIVLFALLFVGMFFVTVWIYQLLESIFSMYEYNASLRRYAGFLIIFCLIFIVAYYFILKKNNIAQKYLLILVALLEVSLFTYFLLGRPAWRGYASYQHGAYVEYANEAKSDLNIEEDELNRIKNPDLSLNTNYPLILRRASLSSYTAAIPIGMKANLKNWGYSEHHTYLLDSGGTIFSDALLNIKQQVNTKKLNEELYELVKHTEKYYLYNNKYTLPFGMTVSDSVLETNINDLDWVEVNNLMYQLLTGNNEKLVTSILEGEEKSKEIKNYTYNKEGNKLSFDIDIKKESVLYFSSNQRVKITINGEEISIPSVGEPDLKEYPNTFNNNVIELGSFKNEIVEVEIESLSENKNDIQINLELLDLEKMKKLCTLYEDYSVNEQVDKTNLTFNVTGTEDRNVVLVPIEYDEGWTISINGKKIEKEKVSNILGIFTAIELEEGDNAVTMHFTPKGLKTGIIITIISLLACLILKKYKKVSSYIEKMSEYAFYGLWGVTLCVVYIIPVLYFVWIQLISIA